MHAFRTYIFCQSLHTLQGDLAAIADLLVILSPEGNARFRSSGRRRQSIPGQCSGHWKCSVAVAKCSSD